MDYKRILTIQDISCVGQCSLTVALPILSACGLETAILPSAVLSTHTAGFKGFTFRDLASDMPAIFRHWKSENIEFDGESDIGTAVSGCVGVGNNDGLAIIISDFFTDSDWKKAVDFLCFKKKQVLLIQVMTPDEIEPAYDGRVNLIDAEANGLEDLKNLKIKINRSNHIAYAEALNDMKEELKSFCASRGADFISVSTDQPLEKMLFKELLKVGIMA